MSNYIIAKEGYRLILAAAIISLAVFLTSSSLLMMLMSLLLLAGVIYLFRNQNIEIERFEKGEILSVCDGVVTNIETLECKGSIKGECFKVTIVNRLIDKGELRAPFDSLVPSLEYHRGMQLALYSKKSTYLNENAKILFRSSLNSDDIVVVKHALNRFNIPLSFYLSDSQRVQIGERYGFMLHGESSVFLPSTSRLAIKVGDELSAGESLLGYFTR